jgi:hypothetical protein
MTALLTNNRWRTAFEVTSIVVLFAMGLTATTVLAGDSSYRSIVKELRSEYRATEQPLYGAGVLGGITVALVRPAGVSTVNFTILRDLKPKKETARDFNALVRSAIDAKWKPIVTYSAPSRGEWTHVYSHPDGKHISLLVVTRANDEAVVAEVRLDPDQLIAFINNPRILGIEVGSR